MSLAWFILDLRIFSGDPYLLGKARPADLANIRFPLTLIPLSRRRSHIPGE